MINIREKRKEKNKGITILALVVTIIVLLILAGVTLATLTGDNGILTKSKRSKEEYKKAQYEDAIEFAKLQAQTEQGKYKIDAEKFLRRVKDILKNNDLFKDAPSEEEDDNWKIENNIDGDENKWKLNINTVEGLHYEVEVENTKYIGIEEDIKTVTAGDIRITYEDKWTQGPIMVTITKVNPEEHATYQIQYSYDETTWQNYNSPIAIEKNKYIYARLTNDGTDVTRPHAKEKITKIDKLPPNEFVIKKESEIITTDSITIMGETTDRDDATTEYGCSGIEKYYFSKDNGKTWEPTEGQTQTSYTFSGLKQKTTYQLKMKAVDYAGNERETEEVEITTEGVPELKEEDEGSERANVTFSHDPVGWTNGNVTVTIDTTEDGYTLQYNTGDRNNEADWKNYDSPVVMTENGSIYARLKDNANNKGEAIEHKITTIEREKPTIQIQANTTSISQTKQITITAGDTGGSELLEANYYQYYVSTSGTELLGGSWQNYTSGTPFTIGGTGVDGTRYVWVKQIADNAGNKSEANNGIYHVSSAYQFDNTAPTCTITTNVNNPTNASNITYTFQFSEAVTGFASSDITVTNGTKGTFSAVSTSKYTLVVTNNGSCSQTVSIAVGVCTDTAGNGNTAQSKTITIDRTAPTCTITANKTSPTNATSVTYTFTWSETLANNTFTIDDISVMNGSKGTFTTITANRVYTLVVNNTGSCSQTVSIVAGVCTDTVGNGNTAQSKTITIDRTAPTCTITANVNSPTNATSVTYTFTWSEAVTGFASSDVTVTNGTKGTFSTVSTSKYTLVVSNSGSCSQTISIVAGVCTDTAGNGNTAQSKTITIDRTAPTCTITANVNSPTNASSITYTFQFSEAVTGFASSDITVTNGTKGTFSTVSTSTYTLVVSNSGSCSQTVSIATGVCTDTAGNGNTAQSKAITIDRTAPTCTITTNVNSPTNASSITYTFTWSESVIGFTVDDIRILNSSGTKGKFTEITANQVYTLVVTNTGTTYQSLSIDAGACTDGLGNNNTAVTKSMIVDRTAPTIGKIDVTDTTRGTINQGIVKGNKGGITLSNIVESQSQVVGYYITNKSSTTPKANATGWQSPITSTIYCAITPDSTATYYIWIKDGAGNVSSRYEVKVQDAIAQVGSVNYPSIQSAIDAVPDNTQKTVKLLVNNYTGEEPRIWANKNIIFDLNGNTLNDRVGNYGTVTITNGTIDTTNKHALYNNPSGIATITGKNTKLTSNSCTITNIGNLTITEEATIESTATAGNVIYIGKDYVTETTVGGGAKVIHKGDGTCIHMREATPSKSTLILRGATFESNNGTTSHQAAVANVNCPVIVYDSNKISNPKGGYAIATFVNWTYYGGCEYNGKILHE